MKIAIVCYPTYGGSGVVATMLGTALAQRGHEIHFVTYKQPVRLELLAKNIFFHEVNVEEYPLFHYQPYDLALSSKLVNVVQEYDIELLHVHYAIPHAYAGYMAQQMLKDLGIKLPMVTTLHGTDITLVGNHPVYKPSVTFSINNSDVVTSVSDSLKRDTLDLFDITKHIDVVPNFIDMSNYKTEFTDCDRTVMAFPEERIITHVSNMRPVKRIMDVVKIFEKIQEKIPAILIMVGDGPERFEAEEYAKSKKLQLQIKWVGNSTEIDRILCFTDLFLLPSEKESFGLAALEAMANKTPVISSNTGGLPEVNEDGVTGFTSNVGDIDEMAQKAIHILEEDERLLKFKNNAFAKAKEFDIQLIIPQYEKLYKNVLSVVSSNK
ncbi:N-acetyl-alpha-D-glucosaminyl L-malate synthase BshA [Nonlabens ulvanivorans]|uniref:N-acetyl-alpha-D-glucosaminyl L-malate synthase n=1 Tax=Nonlabens ulvanivorans TaxID=906888 RepID=A0A084K066_NONUL|nr:N-acetyl-alpha-D-glucosaminyl L-malate synthase BshA [Nonlabens ulvanivorans]KEZ94600.1 N-acetyl-alpha-D-glucosaminyl L-malate synthase [Nonlabens ulvanivorans]PRX12512.1 N-acetyl-alpha-D-glucosaminyl L-malate synthase BshA [Nonlabens ulvanivorans]